MTLMGHLMAQEPYQNAPRVFVIVDNGSDHELLLVIKFRLVVFKADSVDCPGVVGAYSFVFEVVSPPVARTG